MSLDVPGMRTRSKRRMIRPDTAVAAGGRSEGENVMLLFNDVSLTRTQDVLELALVLLYLEFGIYSSPSPLALPQPNVLPPW